MPLTQEEIQQLRQTPIEQHTQFYIRRIALTLEDILGELRIMNERGQEGRPGEGRHPLAD